MNNEITAKIECSIKELVNILENKGFKVVQRFLLNDTYFVPENLSVKALTPREILAKAVILRDISDYMPLSKSYKLTFKTKEIDEKGTITSQDKVDCEISNCEDGKNFLIALGYRVLLNIKENDVVYEKEGLRIAIKDIINGDNLIEVETVDNNKQLNSIEKIIRKIDELDIPISTNDYFIKKAEIELGKIL